MKLNIIYRVYDWIFLDGLDLNKLSADQRELAIANLKKHTHVSLIVIATLIYSYLIISNYYTQQIDIVVTALLGVLLASGSGWFMITFGAIPARFMNFAIRITSYLFTSFAVSLAATLVAISIAVPLLTPVFLIAFYSLYSASVKYDIVDALKLGIDETMYKHAKVGRLYFIRELKKKKEDKCETQWSPPKHTLK